MDIGGGSTEFIIGRGLKPLRLESIYMGCVSYSLKYFPEGKLTKNAMKRAELAARNELQTIVAGFANGNWQQAVGSSGSARALAEILQLNGYSESGITPEGLDRLRSAMIRAGELERLDLKGVRSDRLPVLPGGLAIMSAALSELGIEFLVVADGSMRQGILYDLLGRVQHHDMRDVTVSQFMQRHHVDSTQARRVASLALALYRRFTAGADDIDDAAPHCISWAAKLHEIGISVAYSGYHKHSAYIVQNADMPGFSKMEQWRLSTLVLAHRRSLKKIFTRDAEIADWRMVMALRLAALIYRSRADVALPEIDATAHDRTLRLGIDRAWLANNPLTVTALQEEIEEWDAAGFKLDIKSLRELEAGVEAQAA
jgi:exopolyphosphatase/guanosine-5'-triphosphate,3'-diphosphate pyrophosphatase